MYEDKLMNWSRPVVVSTLIDEPVSSISISPIDHWDEKPTAALVSRVAGCDSARHLERWPWSTRVGYSRTNARLSDKISVSRVLWKIASSLSDDLESFEKLIPNYFPCFFSCLQKQVALYETKVGDYKLAT